MRIMLARQMNLLGWMRAPEESLAHWDDHAALAAAVRADGLSRTLVCGMGGSSLVADVLAATFGVRSLHVLDSTNPDAVRATGQGDLGDTLFVISSKSGNTIETLAFYHYFAARAARAIRRDHRDGHAARRDLARPRGVNVGAAQVMGTGIADRARIGRDKLCLSPPPRIAALANWIEQLIAESSGKEGRGIIPVVQEPNGGSVVDSQTVGPDMFSADPLDLGAEFLRWEYATVALCERLGVNAFDQPDVEEAKRLARAELEGGRNAGAEHAAPLPTLTPAQLRQRARPGDYFAILAYVPPTADVFGELQKLRAAWGRTLRCATTLGFGPRYLHSTGQLHKGGPDSGLFLVITTDVTGDIEIPEMGWTFGELHRAQARGDVRALLARGRRVAHVHLSSLADLSQLMP